MHKNQNTMPPHLPSQPLHEVGVCEENKYPRQKLPWCHSSTKQKRTPHHKVDEQPNKKPKRGYCSHKRSESDDKNAVAIVKFVSQRGKQRRKVLGSIRKVRFTQSTLRQASIQEKKGPLGKIQVKHSHQRSPTRKLRNIAYAINNSGQIPRRD